MAIYGPGTSNAPYGPAWSGSVRGASQDALYNKIESMGAGGGPLVYVALLTQLGSAAPVATIIANTLGGTVVFSRDDVGTYLATLAGAFTAKTVCFLTAGAVTGVTVAAYRSDSNTVTIVVEQAGSANDGLLSGASFKIEVWPA